MTEIGSEKPFGIGGYVQPQQGKMNPVIKFILIGLGVVLVFGLGSCVWGLGSLFGMASERQSATDAFIDKALIDGMPGVDSEIWSKQAGIDPDTYPDFEEMVMHFLPGKRTSDTSCNANMSARTNGPSGTFVMCVTQTSYEATEGHIEITWIKESEDWKLLRLLVNFVDTSSFYEAKARKKILSEGLREIAPPAVNVPED